MSTKSQKKKIGIGNERDSIIAVWALFLSKLVETIV